MPRKLTDPTATITTETTNAQEANPNETQPLVAPNAQATTPNAGPGGPATQETAASRLAAANDRVARANDDVLFALARGVSRAAWSAA